MSAPHVAVGTPQEKNAVLLRIEQDGWLVTAPLAAAEARTIAEALSKAASDVFAHEMFDTPKKELIVP